MASLFISYSRKDVETARRLTRAFQDRGLDFWIDWEGIPPTVDWWKEIQKGIEEADIFLFLLSPDSAKSNVCKQEIEHAVKNGKRLIPIVVRDVQGDVPSELRSLNWIFIRKRTDFVQALDSLMTAINTDYEWVQVHRQLQNKALEWQRSNNEDSFLLHGKELQEAEFQLRANASKEPDPTDLQQQYVHRSRQSTNRQRRVLSGVGIAAILAIVLLGIYGWVQAGYATANAETAQAESTRAFNNAGTAQVESTRAVNNAATAQANANMARAGELVALALSQRDRQFDLSLLLSVEAFRRADIYRTRNLLLDNLQIHPQWFWALRGQTEVSVVAFSPKDEILASGSVDGTVLLWDWFNQKPIGQLRSAGDYPVVSIAFHPDGSLLAIGESDLITLWDMKSLQQIGQPIETPGWGLMFSPDGKTLAARHWGITLWDVVSHQSIGQLPAEEDPDPKERIFTAAFLDEKTIVSGGCKIDPRINDCYPGQIILWDIASLRPVAEIIEEEVCAIGSIAVSPDGLRIAAGDVRMESKESCYRDDGVIFLRDASSLQMIGQPIDIGYSLYHNGLAFSVGGATLASVGSTGVVIWDVPRQKIIAQHPGELLSQANSVTFDGYTLAVGGCMKDISTGICNGTIMLWSQYSFFPRWDHLDGVDTTSVAFSPDGRTLAWGIDGSTIRLWDREKFQRTQLDAGVDGANQIAYSPGGKFLASAGRDNVLLWDMQSQQLIGPLLKNDAVDVAKIAFSPDGKTLAGGGCDKFNYDSICTGGVILFWDVASRQPIGQPVHSDAGQVNHIAFSADGKTLASGHANRTILLWDVASHQTIGKPLGEPTENWFEGNGSGVLSVAFSPDGSTLVSGNDNGTLILWDVVSHEAIGQPLERYKGPILTLAISPDGKILAAGGGDNESAINLWNLENRQPISQPLDVGGAVWSLLFSQDGKWLASASEAGPMIWKVDPQSWTERTCQRAARNLTRIEWEKYFLGEEYRATCPQWPLEPEPMVSPSPTP